MKWDWKDFVKKALIRALRTFAQAFVAAIGVGAAFEEVDWLRALSVSGVSFVLSILTSLATGLPEVKLKEEESVEELDPPEDQETGDE